jgi:hypothetical protein
MDRDIEIRDPRGYLVRCSAEYWNKHILVKHPDLAGCETYAEGAIQQPTHHCIYASKSHDSRVIYYGALRKRIEIKVVVQFDDVDKGTIVSVTACSKRPEGEKLVWYK